MSRVPYVAPADAEPWERRDGEGEAAYEAFVGYLEQGLGRRSMRVLAKTLNKSLGLVAVWARDFEWRARVDAHTNYERRLAQEHREVEIRTMQRRHVRTMAELSGALILPLEAALKPRQYKDPHSYAVITVPRMDELEAMHTADLLDLLRKNSEVVAKLIGVERLVNDLPTEISSHRHSLDPDLPADPDSEEPSDEERLLDVIDAIDEAIGPQVKGILEARTGHPPADTDAHAPDRAHALGGPEMKQATRRDDPRAWPVDEDEDEANGNGHP